MIVFNFLIIIFSSIYLIIVLWLIVGWLRLKYYMSEQKINSEALKISIIIPVKDEKDNIVRCMEAIRGQTYPSEIHEVIIVDDNSTDETPELVDSFIKDYSVKNFKLVSLSLTGKYGKKNALNKGIEESKYDYILTTDADCEAKPNWLKVINSFYNQFKSKMIIMPVAIEDKGNLFSKLQMLEFMSLIGVAGSTAGWGSPVLCNGANLFFSKDVFYKVNGYKENMHYASGDDIFLLQKFKKKVPDKIHFLKNTDSIINTLPMKSLSDFFSQRKRWVSKNRGLKDWLTLFLGLVISGFNVLLIVSLIFMLQGDVKYAFILAWVVKFVVDFPFLYLISSFFRSKRNLWLYPFIAVLYPFYIISCFALVFLKGFSWKGRRFIAF